MAALKQGGNNTIGGFYTSRLATFILYGRFTYWHFDSNWGQYAFTTARPEKGQNKQFLEKIVFNSPVQFSVMSSPSQLSSILNIYSN